MSLSPSLLIALSLMAGCSNVKDPDFGEGEEIEIDSDDSGDSDDTAETGDTGDTGEPAAARITWFDDVGAIDLSPDGSRALVNRLSSFEGELLFLDTTTGELASITTLGDATQDMATGLSAGGRVSALYAVPVVAAVWDEGAGWQELASPYATGCDVNVGGAFDISDDGAVAVGMMWDGCEPAAFRVTIGGEVQPLEILGAVSGGGSRSPTNRATVVSGDGRVAAGFAENGGLDRTPARWTEDGTGELLAPDDRDAPGEVLSISYDGAALGVLRGYDGYRWTESGGLEPLGRLKSALPTDPVYPNAVSADGAHVYGGVGSEYFTVPTAFVWSAAAGMRSVQEVVSAAGVEVGEGYWLTSVMAVSDDETVVLGRGYDPEYAVKTFVLHVPPGTWE